MQTDVSPDERVERLSKLRTRLLALADVKLKLRKLNVALANLAVADPRSQMKLIQSATRYVQGIEKPPQGVSVMLRVVANELQSMREGILARAVKPRDLVLVAGVRTITDIDALMARVQLNIQKVEAAIEGEPTDPNVQLLLKNKEAQERIPKFNGREFIVGRAPTAFTFQNKQKHSSVGYVDEDAIKRVGGFKTDNLGGYTILHNQLVIGIDSHAIYDKEAPAEEGGKPTLKKQRVKETVIVFKKGNPTRVAKARDRTHFDVAQRVLKLIERQYNARFDFVSEYSVGLNGGEFFWIMPKADHVRLARAFPGGHLKIAKWGFAF